MTLVELSVAMAIGLFLIGGALYVYSQSKNSYRASDSLARLQESARFALDTLEPDIRLARYWGLNSEPARINVPAGIAVTCDGADAGLGTGPRAAVSDSQTMPTTLDCPSFNDTPRAGSDVLILRHAEPWRAGVEPAADNRAPPGADHARPGPVVQRRHQTTRRRPAASTNNVAINVYYVSNESSFDASLPSLRRLALGPTGDFDDQEVIPGVENLQVQLGVDTDRDGDVDRYVDGDHPLVDARRSGLRSGRPGHRGTPLDARRDPR